MYFTRLKLQGFKSFVEPTELEIRGGMTGIVGPNGCGKSNLVEALRWVMGETSARLMRGTDMDDVIFAGTTLRPSRNLAEVGLTLDNSDRSATSEYNNNDELLVTRKIERGGGSDYRINGKAVRQRDVQLLFADQATGAHSTSVVGQGQIDALIRAKPQERRQILEEASGTAGLHTRRHEAELKLRAAEQNLGRVDEVLNTLDGQLRGLKQQAKQSSRYRNLAEHIRNTETVLLRLRWQEAGAANLAAEAALTDADTLVSSLTATVASSETARVNMAAGLPDLRQTETTAAAALQRLTLEREQIDGELRRLDGEIRTCERQLAEAQNDATRETARQNDGTTALDRLATELATIGERGQAAEAALPAAKTALETAAQETAARDTALTALMEQAATAEAKLKALEHETAMLTNRRNELTQRRDKLDRERAQLAAEVASHPDLTMSQTMVTACEAELIRRQAQVAAAEQARQDAEEAQSQCRSAVQETDAALMRLRAESEAIESMLRHSDNGQAEKVLDLIAVEPGLEGALAVALGEALSAALDPAAAMHWRDMPPLAHTPPLPHGSQPLTSYVRAPTALGISLSQIGLVDDKQQGEKLASQLALGQIIVSRDGWAWRWDGFTVTPQAVTATAMHLQQRNRLAALQTEIAAASQAAAQAHGSLDTTDSITAQCRALDSEARTSLQAAFAALDDARGLAAKQEREATAANSRLGALDETLHQLATDIAEVVNRAAALDNERSGLPDTTALRLSVSHDRAALAEWRGKYAEHKSECDRLEREITACATRSQVIARESEEWRGRMTGAEAHAAALAARIIETTASLAGLKAKPQELTEHRHGLLDAITTAESARRAATDALLLAEAALTAAETKLRRDDAALATAREDRVRAEAAVEAAREQQNALRARIAEKLDCAPEDLNTAAATDEAVDATELEQQLTKYLRERDNMGPVNLRADIEAEAMQAGIEKLQQEKDDLTAAIARLRHGIGQLNHEARERLNGAFSAVNERFQKLFTGLFNGGKAYLELIDNDDPMNAGLEIFASPPGKKMQVLSLLSGGERTLTALALLFAVFQTNPSPICVLDEAEAALDESNIGRFCDLVETIARETSTRFLIITHQRLTMARMDRLYGVTMAEKGVSQLVSVDLQAAVAMRDGGALATTAILADDILAMTDEVVEKEEAA